MVKVAGTIQKSGEVMKSMNDLMKVSKLQAGMMDLAKEMTKAGLIEDMVDDVMDSVGACALAHNACTQLVRQH
jgi:charged multivesicular body protein 3